MTFVAAVTRYRIGHSLFDGQFRFHLVWSEDMEETPEAIYPHPSQSIIPTICRSQH